MIVRRLSARGGSIEFRIDRRELPLCYLFYVGEKESPLGMEDWRVFFRRLLDFLQDVSDAKYSRHPDGLTWKWIATTFGPYVMFHGRKSGDTCTIKATGNIELARMTFDREKVEEWSRLLRGWLADPEREVVPEP